jgi:signal transduction histidine kinase
MFKRVFKEKIFISEFEFPFPVINGTYIMDAFPLMEEDGIVHYMGVIIKNISELKLIEKGLRKDLQVERDLNELKSRFVTMASHEFRTPLSTVLSSSYLIEKYNTTEDQPKREKHLLRIVKSVNMLTDILNDFLSLGKIEEGKIRTNFSAFNLSEIIVSTIDDIKNNLKNDQQIKYTHEGDTDVFLDLSLMKHILMNLVSNASKFSSNSTIISVKTVQKNNSIVLSVKDEGIGISPEDQKHLMERFFRAANAQNIQGTGLGLHIVARYAEMMEGKLEFKSELGKGSEFIVTIKSGLN